MSVFSRIAIELNARRPDIPLLVVEGRGTAEALERLPVHLSGLANLNRIAVRPDPRDFYRVSRAANLEGQTSTSKAALGAGRPEIVNTDQGSQYTARNDIEGQEPKADHRRPGIRSGYGMPLLTPQTSLFCVRGH
ncbi:hypothetical protein [Aquisphaera insulae]|uniref:hypothetical protein n=1 Tax=Aquisphaera insulae TaxID=2712864 RepID=UPI0013ED3973|nr:hypothetical protein [Aquisphaera insulae]